MCGVSNVVTIPQLLKWRLDAIILLIVRLTDSSAAAIGVFIRPSLCT